MKINKIELSRNLCLQFVDVTMSELFEAEDSEF